MWKYFKSKSSKCTKAQEGNDGIAEVWYRILNQITYPGIV